MKKQHEKMQQDFVKKFPKERISSLTKEKFVIGLGKKDTFCYLLQDGTKELGSIKSCNASKFGVWFKKKENSYAFNRKFGSTFDEAFEQAKQEIVKIIEADKKNDFETIKSSKFGPMVRGKIMFMYNPEKWLPIYSVDHLKHFLIVLGVDFDKNDDHITMQKYLLRYKEQNMNHFDNYQFAENLYERLSPKKENTFDDYDEVNVNKYLAEKILSNQNFDFEDVPEPKQKALKIENGKKVYPRNIENAAKALAKAQYKCELNPQEHISFIKKSDGQTRYTEAHHLIPMRLSGDRKFKNSLDVPANIVSLCSECHNRLHYGQDIKAMLEKLYNERKERLEKAGIKITLKELYKIYGVK